MASSNPSDFLKESLRACILKQSELAQRADWTTYPDERWMVTAWDHPAHRGRTPSLERKFADRESVAMFEQEFGEL